MACERCLYLTWNERYRSWYDCDCLAIMAWDGARRYQYAITGTWLARMRGGCRRHGSWTRLVAWALVQTESRLLAAHHAGYECWFDSALDWVTPHHQRYPSTRPSRDRRDRWIARHTRAHGRRGYVSDRPRPKQAPARAWPDLLNPMGQI